jgi:hypothetical protein
LRPFGIYDLLMNKMVSVPVGMRLRTPWARRPSSFASPELLIRTLDEVFILLRLSGFGIDD